MASLTNRVFLASWLEKKMEWRLVYERRYFTLDGTRLSYRMDEYAPEKGFGTITSFEPWRENAKQDEPKAYCFTVWILEGGSWSLSAATREVYDSWFSAIMTALVPSATASTAASESGTGAAGIHSRRASSLNEGGAPSITGAEESNGLGLAVGLHRSLSPAPRIIPIASDEVGQGQCNGASSMIHTNDEAVASSLTAASLAAATSSNSGAHPPVSASDTVLLSSMVEKEKSWRGKWRPRYMELREGRLLILRSSATSSTERQRYVIEAVDPSPSSAQPTWMLVSTSTGDRFWVRFGSLEERQRWTEVCGRLLHGECTWHWMPLAEEVTGRSWRLRQATSGTFDDLQLHYHCAAMVPSFREETWCAALFVFGGSERWCRPLFHPQARAFLPHADATATLNRLTELELGGPHLTRAIQPAPFKEGPHALVRPLARYGATLTCLPVIDRVPEEADSDASHNAAMIGVRVVLLGGLTGGGYQSTATEIWSLWRSRAACAPGVEVRWGRQDLPAYELPNLTFHDAVYVPWGSSTSGAADPAYPHDGFLLVTGGLDVEFRCRSECYAVLWKDGTAAQEADTEERAYRATPLAYAFGQLPSPRAFHRTAVLEDGTVILVGGRGVENAPVAASVLTLAPKVWRNAAASWGVSLAEEEVAAAGLRSTTTPSAEAQELVPNASQNWCSISSEEDADGTRTKAAEDEDPGAPASPWCKAHFRSAPRPSAAATERSSTQQLVSGLPVEMGDVAVAATGSGGRVVVLGQASQPRQEVKLYLLDFEPLACSPQRISAGEQFPEGTRHVRCYEVLLFVGAVPSRVVGTTIHIYNGYLYVIGGCAVDKSKTDSYELCGPLRVLLE